MPVQPHSLGRTSRISTSSMSPGLAPTIATGPVSGWMTLKSSFARISTLLAGVICPSEASWVSSSTMSPGSTVARGAMLLSQRQWVRSWVRRYLMSITIVASFSLLFKIHFTALCQCLGGTLAQDNDDDQAQHKPGGTDGTGQVEWRSWQRDKLEVQHNGKYDKGDGREDDVPHDIEGIGMFAPVEEWHSQAGYHVHQDDRNANNGAQQTKGGCRTIDQPRPQGQDDRDDHGQKDGDVRCAVAIGVRQGDWQCPGTTHRVEHTCRGIDACVGIRQRTIENRQADDELEGSPDAAAHGCPGIGIVEVGGDLVEAPTDHARVGAEHIEDADQHDSQQNGTWHRLARVVRFLGQWS